MAVLAAVSFFAAVVIRHWLVPLGSGDADEGSYLYLSDLLRHGHATMSVATHDPFFRPWLTGVANGHYVYPFEPGWPAVLALSQTVFHSKLVGVALCAAGLVVATYAFAREMLGSRRTAVIAAAIVTFSPIFLLHSALYLSYLFTALLATTALACARRALRVDARVWPAATGALLAAMVLTRPFDAFLIAVPLGLMVLLLGRRDLRRLGRIALVALFAALPLVAVAMVFNKVTTGSPLQFPQTVADPRNTFGFGEKGLQAGTDSVPYFGSDAWQSLQDNASGALGWVFGGVLTFAFAVWAVTRREHRRERVVLLVGVLVFPAGYYFWWASVLAAPGATNGLGPHYWVPSFVPLAVLGADGFARLSRRHLAAACAVGVAALGVTAFNVPDKVTDKQFVSDIFIAVDRAIPPDLHDAIVFIDTDDGGYTTLRYPFLVSDPDLDSSVLYPTDRQGENGQLILAHPTRRAYLVHPELHKNDPLLHPPWVLTPIGARAGASVPLHLRTAPPLFAPGLQAYASSDDGGTSVPLADDGTNATDVGVTLVGPNAGPVSGPALELTPGQHDVVVGVRRTDSGERWERVYHAYVADDGTVTVVTPGIGQHFVDLGKGLVRLPEDVSDVIANAD